MIHNRNLKMSVMRLDMKLDFEDPFLILVFPVAVKWIIGDYYLRSGLLPPMYQPSFKPVLWILQCRTNSSSCIECLKAWGMAWNCLHNTLGNTLGCREPDWGRVIFLKLDCEHIRYLTLLTVKFQKSWPPQVSSWFSTTKGIDSEEITRD